MTFGVHNQFTVGLNVNGVEVPLHSSGYNSLYVYNNAKDILPSASVSIRDVDGALFDNMPVGSGTPFSVTIGGGAGNQSQTVDFKTYGVPVIARKGHHVDYQINGIMNRPRYMQDRPKQAWAKQNSSDVIGALAGMCGLSSFTHSFNDKMTWFAGPNQTFSQFSHQVADRGYRGSKSITALSVLDTNELRYVDLAQIMTEGPSAVYQSGYDDGHLIIDHQIQDHMGFANAKMNHGMRMVQEGLDGAAKKITEFAVPLLSGSLDMNGAEKGLMDHVRNVYAAPDVGNTHDNYKQAEYQNQRGRLTFGLIVEVLLNYPTPAHLFDLVTFRVRNPMTGKPSVYNGNYIVMAKTRYVKGSYYYEKLELKSQGITGDGGGQFLLPTSIQDAVGGLSNLFQGFRF